MYKIEIKADSLRQDAIDRRRRLDAERKQRIFNPKVRILGVDLEALDEQVKTKVQQKEAEKKRNYAFDHSAKLTNEILEIMDHKVQEKTREQLKRIQEFRLQEQMPHQRREFDLNDPMSLKKDLPARTGDDDPRIGVSSLQRFEGEDLAQGNRQDLQKEQIRVWTDQQLYEKEVQRMKELEEKKKYDEFQNNILSKMEALQTAVDKARKDRAKLDNEYNAALADEKRRREQQQKAYETEQNLKEMNKIWEQSEMLGAKIANVNGRKVYATEFKGLAPNELESIRHVQEEQRKDHQKRFEKKQREEELWAIQQAATNRALELLEREKARQHRQQLVQLRQQNDAKAVDDKKRQHYLDKVLYTNRPNESYFQQFNTTSR